MMKFLYFLLIIHEIYAQNLDYDIVTDYSVNDCLRVNNEQKLNYFDLDSSGFPYCAKYDQSATCDPNIPSSCAPGLKCVGGYCVVDTSSCFKYYANVNGNQNIMDLLWTPDCLKDGTWAPKQCKGGTAGRCFCYGSQGNRIFGDAFAENSANMTCACSRRRVELLDPSNSNKRSYVSFHCDNQGNYEELQCDTGHCWCVETKTGKPTTMIVPESAMSYLSCSNKLKGSQYLRKCESQAYAQSKIMEEMKRRGVTSPNIQITSCGGDGSYGPYTIQNSAVYCVTKTNAKTTYQTTIKEINSLDCNCALDIDLYSRLGKEFTLVCQNNGNYEPLQSILEDHVVKSFCVDKDGNKKKDNVDPNKNSAYCDKYFD